jgi:integrase
LAPEAQQILADLSRVDGNNYVIAGEGKDPIRHLHHAWHRLQKRASIEHARIHDLRHTYASNAVMHGVNIVMVSKLLGHLHIQTTMRYAHLADDPVREAAAEVAAILGRSLTTSQQSSASISEFPKLRLSTPSKIMNAIEADQRIDAAE